jgi:hypothetical protein
MRQLSLHRKLALAAALVSALSLTGAAMAASPHPSSHASPTAVTHVAANATNSSTDTDSSDSSAKGDAVSAAAQSALTGGPRNNHGGYVSCIARGGSNCTAAVQTLPIHGKAATHSQADSHTP